MTNNLFSMPAVTRSGLWVTCCHCSRAQTVKEGVRSTFCVGCGMMFVFRPISETEEVISAVSPPITAERYNQLRHDWMDTDKMAGHPHRKDVLDLFRVIERQTDALERLSGRLRGNGIDA